VRLTAKSFFHEPLVREQQQEVVLVAQILEGFCGVFDGKLRDVGLGYNILVYRRVEFG
jgi:hypothetical protein